jgi:hypothetical protein
MYLPSSSCTVLMSENIGGKQILPNRFTLLMKLLVIYVAENFDERVIFSCMTSEIIAYGTQILGSLAYI